MEEEERHGKRGNVMTDVLQRGIKRRWKADFGFHYVHDTYLGYILAVGPFE
jgi:hypothetical protein